MVFTSVIAVIRGEIEQIYLTKGIRLTVIVAVVIIAVIGFVVFMEQAQRRILVQYAKRMTGRRVYGTTSTYIPGKVNQGGGGPRNFGHVDAGGGGGFTPGNQTPCGVRRRGAGGLRRVERDRGEENGAHPRQLDT